jgi:hypothetical protein
LSIAICDGRSDTGDAVLEVLLRIIIPFGSLYYAYVYTQKKTDGGRQAPSQQARLSDEANTAPARQSVVS